MDFDPDQNDPDIDVNIKQEQIVKSEPLDVVHSVFASTSAGVGSENETVYHMKSESETDDELHHADLDLMKEEVGWDEKDPKKEGKSTNNTSSGEYSASGNRSDEPMRAANIDRGKPNPNGEVKRLKYPKERRNISKKHATDRKLKHKCQLCPYKTSRKTDFTRHTRFHTGEKPFQCIVCFKDFSQKINLQRHTKTHDSMLQFRCSNCRRGFTTDMELVEHAKKCDRMRRYECYLCTFRTTNNFNLMYHMRTHNGERPFQCSICYKSFARNTTLNLHSRTHVYELQFGCSKCGQRFAEQGAKELHEPRCKQRQYECYLCRYKCSMKSSLNRHVKTKHTDNTANECGNRGKTFVNKSGLKRHLITHREYPHRCSKCPRIFMEENEKVAHEELCRRRQRQCYLCKSFKFSIENLRRHMRAHHTGQRPFPCRYCSACFNGKGDAKRHMKNVHRIKMI